LEKGKRKRKRKRKKEKEEKKKEKKKSWEMETRGGERETGLRMGEGRGLLVTG